MARALAPIARDGKVYKLASEPLTRPAGRTLTVSLEGVRRASTFRGFCGFHDSDLFRPLDEASYAGSQFEAGLLLYRALGHELSKKQWVLDVLRGLEPAGPGGEINQAMQVGTAWSVIALLEHLDSMERVLTAGAFGDVRCEVFESSDPASVVGSCLWFPDFDFEGELLQEIPSFDHVPGMAGFFAMPTTTGSCITVAWHRDSSWCVERFLNSLARSQPTESIGDRLFRAVLLTGENVFFRPSWWESLEAEARARLVAVWNQTTSMEEPIDPLHLRRIDALPLRWALDGVRSTRGAG
jgi:hypothetical protein